jgi:hypothetical protein
MASKKRVLNYLNNELKLYEMYLNEAKTVLKIPCNDDETIFQRRLRVELLSGKCNAIDQLIIEINRQKSKDIFKPNENTLDVIKGSIVVNNTVIEVNIGE